MSLEGQIMTKDKIGTYLQDPICLLFFDYFLQDAGYFFKSRNITQIFPVLAGAHDALKPIICKRKH